MEVVSQLFDPVLPAAVGWQSARDQVDELCEPPGQAAFGCSTPIVAEVVLVSVDVTQDVDKDIFGRARADASPVGGCEAREVASVVM